MCGDTQLGGSPQHRSDRSHSPALSTFTAEPLNPHPPNPDSYRSQLALTLFDFATIAPAVFLNS